MSYYKHDVDQYGRSRGWVKIIKQGCVVIFAVFTMWTDAMAASINIVRHITKEALDKNFPPNLMLGIAKVESGLNPKATNWHPSPQRGLFQIQDRTAKSFCKIRNPKSLYNYKVNTRCAIKYITYLYDIYGDYTSAVLAFNAGRVRCVRDRNRSSLASSVSFYSPCRPGKRPVNLAYFLKVEKASRTLGI